MSHMLIKEKLMPRPLTCYSSNCTALSCVDIDGLDQAEELQRHDANIVFSAMTELGGGQ